MLLPVAYGRLPRPPAYTSLVRAWTVVATVAALLGVISACATDTAPTPSIKDPQPPPRIEGADPWQPFELYTHCGIDKSLIEFDGEFWQAVGPGPLNDGNGNPPAGFGNPFDLGWIARTEDESAVYQSSRGVPLFLRRLDLQPNVGMCR